MGLGDRCNFYGGFQGTASAENEYDALYRAVRKPPVSIVSFKYCEVHAFCFI